MKTITIVTTATASIRETWTYTVEDDVADALVADPATALELLAENEIAGTLVNVTDEITGDEEDREVEEVRVLTDDDEPDDGKTLIAGVLYDNETLMEADPQ